MIDRFDVGERIKKLRIQSKITQEELGSELYTTRSTVQKWERGMHLPSNGMLLKLTKKFDVSTEWLLNGSDSDDK